MAYIRTVSFALAALVCLAGCAQRQVTLAEIQQMQAVMEPTEKVSEALVFSWNWQEDTDAVRQEWRFSQWIQMHNPTRVNFSVDLPYDNPSLVVVEGWKHVRSLEAIAKRAGAKTFIKMGAKPEGPMINAFLNPIEVSRD